MIRCTGKEWRDFCAALPDCVYFEDCGDPDIYADDERLRFEGGYAAMQSDELVAMPGVLSMHELERMRDDADVINVATLFRRWKTAQASTTLLVQIPKADAEKFAALMKANGWKVVKS